MARGTRSSIMLCGMLCAFALPVQSFGQANPTQMQALGTISDLTPPTALSGLSNTMIAPEDFSKLRISPGFQISVQAFDVPELNGLFRVEDNGDIHFPLAGSIHVSGLTPVEAGRTIESRLLEAKLLNHPQVSVAIQQYSPYLVTVTGEVRTPGRVSLIAPHSLMDVLSLVGGETEIAGDHVQIRHANQVVDSYFYKKNGDGQTIRDVMVVPGDSVIVPRAGIVYVLGSVLRPGGYLMQEDGDLDVAQALSLALGPNLQAKVSSISIVRRKPDGTYETIPADYQKFTSGREVAAKLLPEDIVYVPVSKVKTIFTTGAGLIGAAATSTVYAFRP